MRLIFSVAGLLVVVAVVGLLAKKQLQALQPAPGGGVAASTPAAAAPAQALQRQTTDDVKKALDAGMRRNGEAEGR